ncbi:MAG: hypothetical protein R3C05_18670 [Pirellulaceae bacterium]
MTNTASVIKATSQLARKMRLLFPALGFRQTISILFFSGDQITATISLKPPYLRGK